MKRAIHLFPDFSADHLVDEFRSKHDSLARKIRPHDTLVFPFLDDIDDTGLFSHISVVARKFEEFEISFSKPIKEGVSHLWLPVSEGKESIERIHDELYQGPLEKHFRSDRPYQPHVTLGVVHETKMKQALIGARL